MADTVGILFGYGSVGRRHAKALATLVSDLYIVDLSETARCAAMRDYPSAEVVPDLETLDSREPPWASALAIIATWGPSHAGICRFLIERGVRKIICEKPLATSIVDAEGMVRCAAQAGVSLVSNHYMRNSGFIPSIVQLTKAHGFGAPTMMTVVGGAHCLVTNGIHWIDAAMQIFGSIPESVMSTVYGDTINPRSKDFLHFGGSAVWRFGERRELIIALTNHSSVHPIAQIYYRDAVVEIDESYHVTLRRRPAEALATGAPVTRTGHAGDVLFTGPPPGVLSMEDALRHNLRRLLNGDESLSPVNVGMAALNTCIGALAAASHGAPLGLPLAPDSPWGRRQWPIT